MGREVYKLRERICADTRPVTRVCVNGLSMGVRDAAVRSFDWLDYEMRT